MNVNLEDTFNFQELLQELGGFKTEIRGQMQVPRIGQVQPDLKFVKKNYMTQFLGNRSLHNENAYIASIFASNKTA